MRSWIRSTRNVLGVFLRDVNLDLPSDPLEHPANGGVVARDPGVAIANHHVKDAVERGKTAGGADSFCSGGTAVCCLGACRGPSSASSGTEAALAGRAVSWIGNGPRDRASAETTTRTSEPGDGVATRTIERPSRTAIDAGVPIVQNASPAES